MSKTNMPGYVEGYIDAVSEMKACINQSILKNNGAKSLLDVLDVYNDIVDFTYVQLGNVEEMVDKLEEQVGIEDVEFDETQNPIAILVTYKASKEE